MKEVTKGTELLLLLLHLLPLVMNVTEMCDNPLPPCSSQCTDYSPLSLARL